MSYSGSTSSFIDVNHRAEPAAEPLTKKKKQQKSSQPPRRRQPQQQQQQQQQVLSLSDINIESLNVDRGQTKTFEFVLRRMCPPQTSRCQQCMHPFRPVDQFLVKSFGERSYTMKGKEIIKTGNFYLHYLRDCLEKAIDDFEWSKIFVSIETQRKLDRGIIEELIGKGITLNTV